MLLVSYIILAMVIVGMSYLAYRVAKNRLPRIGTVTASVLTVASTMLTGGPSFAQSDGINIGAIDLGPFYTWFNDMFAVIFPIALIGAGISAGIAFAFKVANIISNAFGALR